MRLIPTFFRPTRSIDERPTDIGTRLSRYLPHLGDDDRNRLADVFVRLGSQGRLKVDISNARLDRGGWSEFLNQCRGTIATELGSWFLERDDETVDAIRTYVRENSRHGVMISNDSPLRKLGHKLPRQVRTVLRRLSARAQSATRRSSTNNCRSLISISGFLRDGSGRQSTENASVRVTSMRSAPRPVRSCFAAASTISLPQIATTWRSQMT